MKESPGEEQALQCDGTGGLGIRQNHTTKHPGVPEISTQEKSKTKHLTLRTTSAHTGF